MTENEYDSIYRYMNNEYILKFFETGELRIPSFKQCRINEDDTRRDTNDGIHIDTDTEGLGLFVNKKIDTYVLSCSTEKNKKFQEDFSVDGCLEITKPIEFFKIICSKMDIKNPSETDMGKVRYTDNPNDDEKLVHFSLIKRKEFIWQKEFRFVFRKSSTDLHYYVYCPEAVQFCKQITLQ